jgi:uncharacterized protein YjbI with pentapeptide repeats
MNTTISSCFYLIQETDPDNFAVSKNQIKIKLMLNPKMIGNKITEARRKMNISQAMLAQRLFISSQAVGKWERGESMPDIITLNRLAAILDVDLNYFSEGIEPVATKIPPVEFSERPPAGKKLSWDMSRGNWMDADFSGLENLHEKFSSSNLLRCLFIGSDLSRLLLKSNNVVNCDFSGSDFSNSHIQYSHLANNLFKDCLLEGTEFFGSYVSGCDFTGANFTGVVVKSGGFEKNTLADVVWSRTSFIDIWLAEIIFQGTLEDCYFENCKFNKVTFRNSTLINTFFKNKNLKRIRFIDCQADRMTYAFLKNGKADLTGITLFAS